MIDVGASAAMAGLVATDLTVADHAELAVAARSVARLQAFVDHAKVQINRRTKQLASEGDRTSEHVLLDAGRLSGKDAVIVNPDGTIDQLCAEQRTANRQQRRMLAAMYHTCAHPHCQTGFTHCRIHDIEWFTNGGKTILANLLPLCDQHHHLVHEGHSNLTIDHRRHLTWIKPDGTIWHTDTGPPRTVRARGRPPDHHVASTTSDRPPAGD